MKWLSALPLDDFLDTTSFGIVEFKPALADGLMKTMAVFSIEEGNGEPTTIDFVAKPSSSPNAISKIQRRLAEGYAFLLRKDAPAVIGSSASIEGAFVLAFSLRDRAGVGGAYSIVRPLIPLETTSKSSGDQSSPLLVSGALLVSVVGLFALALKGAGRAVALP